MRPDKVQGLLGAIGKEDVLAHGWDFVFGHGLDQIVFERGIALGGAVLEGAFGIVAQDPGQAS